MPRHTKRKLRTQKGKGLKRPRKMHRNARSPGMREATAWLARTA